MPVELWQARVCLLSRVPHPMMWVHLEEQPSKGMPCWLAAWQAGWWAHLDQLQQVAQNLLHLPALQHLHRMRPHLQHAWVRSRCPGWIRLADSARGRHGRPCTRPSASDAQYATALQESASYMHNPLRMSHEVPSTQSNMSGMCCWLQPISRWPGQQPLIQLVAAACSPHGRTSDSKVHTLEHAQETPGGPPQARKGHARAEPAVSCADAMPDP